MGPGFESLKVHHGIGQFSFLYRKTAATFRSLGRSTLLSQATMIHALAIASGQWVPGLNACVQRRIGEAVLKVHHGIGQFSFCTAKQPRPFAHVGRSLKSAPCFTTFIPQKAPENARKTRRFSFFSRKEPFYIEKCFDLCYTFFKAESRSGS